MRRGDESKRSWAWVGDYREVVEQALRRERDADVKPLRIRVMSYNILAKRLAEDHYRVSVFHVFLPSFLIFIFFFLFSLSLSLFYRRERSPTDSLRLLLLLLCQ